VARDRQRVVVQFLPRLVAQRIARRDLHHFLEAPLHRTVALEQMHEVALVVAEDLNFDVLWRFDEFL